MLGALACLAAFAQVSSIPFSENTTEEMVPHQVGMIQDKIDHGNGTADTSNWSGYAVLGSSFDWVGGSWTVPKANCTGVTENQFAAFWAGMDGYNSATVEQIGTDSDCFGKNPFYYAWYEFYPQGQVIITGVPIKPGDKISAGVHYHIGDGKFEVAIMDHTTGKSFSTRVAVPGALRSSAEWIAEAPCCTSTGGILPMTNFGTVTFGLDHTGVKDTNAALDTSTIGAIGAFPAVNTIRITKTSSPSSPQTSSCSKLSTDGTSFSCK